MPAPEVTPAAPIREPVLRGRQPVAALWFPADWFDETERAARLIDCWRAGASALRFAQGDLLCFAKPLDEDCDGLPGWPLRLEGRALCSAPLTDAERLIPRDGDVWIVLGAEASVLDRRRGEALDPSTWLAVEQLSLHDTYDCSVELPPARVLVQESRPLREVLGDAVPTVSHEQADFLEAMRRANREHPDGLPARQESSGDSSSAIFALLGVIGLIAVLILFAAGVQGFHFGGFIALMLLLRLLFAAFRSARAGSVPPGARAAQPQRQLKQRASLVHPQRWRRWLARIAMTTQLSRLLGRAHARHLRRVFGFFDDGNLAEALRHAIPLGGGRGSLGPSFGRLGRRNSLDLSRSLSASTSINFGDDIEQHLRMLYRKAFEKLDREQRFEEAVFVLAELLNAKGEALDYLETHQRFAQAAELALGWDMAPDIIVRLHCLAGDWRMAVAVARRDKAFAGAVTMLEKRWPDVARRLREEWGDALVQQGDWLGAVDAVWPVEALREKATQWLRTAESAGGPLAMRALVQRAVLLPDTLDRYEKELLELQRERSRWRERRAVATALMNVGKTPASQQLAAVIAPALLADHALGLCRFDKRVLEQFARSTGDLLLQVDLPRDHWPGAQAQPVSARTEALCLEAPGAGTQGILDAVPLDDQRYLLALGEAGACVVDVHGRVLSRFAAPAHRLVLAHSNQVALLLARRERVWRVSRLDLVQKVSVDLGVGTFDFCARQFDGLNWTVAEGRRLRVLDTQDSLSQVVWQVADLPGEVRALTTTSRLEQIVVVDDKGAAELWSYHLPQRRLGARSDFTAIEGQLQLLNPAGGSLAIAIEESAGLIGLKWQVGNTTPIYHVQAALHESLRFWLAGEWLVVGTNDESSCQLRWLKVLDGVECARLEWPPDSPPDVRPHDDRWMVFDERGRVLAFDVSSSGYQAFALH